MNYYVECQNVLSRNDLEVLNEEHEVIGAIRYHKQNSDYQISCVNQLEGLSYFCKSNPLRLRPRYQIFDEGKKQIARVSLGVKIIHSIIESDKYYFVKAAFWKIKYQVYDNRTVVSALEVVRINKKRYFKITSNNNDFLTVFALFLLAQAVRMKVLLN